MIRLSREIRFALVANDKEMGKPINGWAGWPASNQVVPHLTLQLIVSGNPNPQTGYLCNIKSIDVLLRRIVTEQLIPLAQTPLSAESMLQVVARELKSSWSEAMTQPESHAIEPPDLDCVIIHLSPYLRFQIALHSNNHSSDQSLFNKTTDMSQQDQTHPDAADQPSHHASIVMTQQFEFSAAHRLHCPELDDEKNRQLFGKCNNPEGHGHNYVIEVSLSGGIDNPGGQVIGLQTFEETVKRLVIDRLDHKHLNRDVAYFASKNPSVENIAAAIFNWLEGQFEPAKLVNVKVFETPKTWAECGSA